MTWRVVSLKQICDVDWGNTKLTKSSYVANGEFLAVSAAGADGLIDHYEHEANVSVLSAIGAQCGRMFFPGERFTAIKNTITLTPKADMSEGKFLYYLFTHVELPQRGAGQPFISKGDIEAFRVLIPERLQEQRKIVEQLDSAFEEIYAVEKNLEFKEDKKKQLFKSLLGSAFSFSADSLEQSSPEYNQCHPIKLHPLKEICTVFGDGDWIESKDQSDSGIRLIQTGNVGEGIFKDRIEKARWISEETFQKLRCTEICQGDVLISRLPDPVGRACLLPALEHKAITAVDCSIVRFNEKIMDPKFFVYYSQSSAYKSSIEPLISGSTRQRISRERLGTIMIPIPPLEEQHEIVEKLDRYSVEIELLKAHIQVEKAQAASLRQSLLSRAFTQEEAVV